MQGILLIVLDSVRRDRISPYSQIDLTPNIARFAEQARVYRRAVSSAPWTPPSHASLFTGLYANRHQCWGYPSLLSDDLTTAAQLFSRSGYQCVGASCNPHIRLTSTGEFSQGLARGNQEFLDLWDPWYLRIPPRLARCVEKTPRLARWAKAAFRRLTPRFGAEKGASKALGFLLRSISQCSGRPFFAFANLMEAHLPYTAPSRFLEGRESHRSSLVRRFNADASAFWGFIAGRHSLDEQELLAIKSLYDAAVAYQDWLLGTFFDHLKSLGVWEESVIVILSDHGEHLGEHGLFNHSVSVYEPLIHVPLLIKYPQSSGLAGEDGRPVQNVDILPTLLELAGIDLRPPYPFDGECLLSTTPDPGRWLCSELETLPQRFWERHPDLPRERLDTYMIALCRGDRKLIHRDRGVMGDEFFALQDDPNEERNIIQQAPQDELDLFYSRIKKHRKRQAGPSLKPGSEEGSLVEERLKALGYL